MQDSSFDDESQLLRVFPTETSNDPETKGIDMYSQYLDYGENVRLIYRSLSYFVAVFHRFW